MKQLTTSEPFVAAMMSASVTASGTAKSMYDTATVTAVMVTVGQAVARGDTLVVLEAMKMEIPLRAPRYGRVTTVRCTQGDQVDAGVPLVELD